MGVDKVMFRIAGSGSGAVVVGVGIQAGTRLAA